MEHLVLAMELQALTIQPQALVTQPQDHLLLDSGEGGKNLSVKLLKLCQRNEPFF